MATLVLGAVGAFVAGPVGLAVGALAGSAIDRSVLGIGAGGTTREGPRLSDLTVQSSAYGAPIPLVFGRARVAGNVIWSTGLIESRQETTSRAQGGKGGGGSRTVTDVTFTYAVSFALALAGRPIAGIGRIWADGKLLRDGVGALSVPGTLRLYTGGDDQAADPLVQSVEGVPDTPAFRGLAYVVFEELALAEFANRIPSLSVEVFAAIPAGEPLATVVTDIAARAGEDRVDATGLAGSVDGFVVTRPMPARAALEALAVAAPHVVAESDGVLRFLPMDGGAAFAAGEPDLGARPSDADPRPEVDWTRGQELEQPREVQLRYWDVGRDYQPGLQRARRLRTLSERTDLREVPVVLTAEAAKRASEVALDLAWLGRDRYAVGLPAPFLTLDPGDRLSLAWQGRTVALLVERVETDGAVVTATAQPFEAAALGSTAAADGGDFPAQTVAEPGVTTLHVLDIPALSDADALSPTLYGAIAGAADGWRGAQVFVSSDEGQSYGLVASGQAPAVMGTAIDVLGAGPSQVWDEDNQVRVQLLRADMTLESRPGLAVLNGANLAVLGGELVQFRDAVLQPDGSYTLSGLLRGRRGSEHLTGTHVAGERFVLLGGGLLSLSPTVADIGRPVLVKAVSINTALADAAAVPVTYTGANLKPLSPVHVAATRDGAGTLEIAWVRRTRYGGGWLDGADVPLGEESERYEVDILSGGIVVRTLATTVPAASYGAAEQVADFGAVQPAVDARVYQLSALVGRGVAWAGSL